MMNNRIELPAKMINKFRRIAKKETKRHPEDYQGNFNYAMKNVYAYLDEVCKRQVNIQAVTDSCELVFHHYITDDNEFPAACQEFYEDLSDVLDCTYEEAENIIEEAYDKVINN